MAILLTLQDAYKSFGSQDILRGASLQIQDGQKVAILGRNGSGKSTLFQILLQQLELDGGEVFAGRDTRIGHLRQHDDFEGDESALAYLMRDSGQPDWRCAEVAARFDVKGERLDGPMRSLSGGWQTRVKLSALLLHDPNLLMLDEPTNFLDLRTQLLLEEFLKTFRGALLLISHDRRFLKASCDWTCELRDQTLTLEPGDVDAYLARQQERREHAERINKNLQSKRDQLQKFVDSNRANANTAAQARNKARQVERLDEQMLDVDEADTRTMRMRIPDIEERKGTALTVTDLSIGYPDTVVATEINFNFEYGKRVAVLGDNGQGKTTLLRTLCDSLDKKAGTIKWGYHCRIGLYAQHVYQSLSGEQSVQEYLQAQARDDVTTQDVLDTAGSFLFDREAVQKPVSVLSGGERARLCLAGLLLGDATVLVLDEPSNHLDIESVQVLSDALKRYKGTILFTSHDSDFVQNIATDVLEVRNGGCLYVPGDYEDYLYRVSQEMHDLVTEQSGQTQAAHKAAPAKQEQNSGAMDYKLAKKLKSVERRIEKRNQEKEALTQQLTNCTDPIAAEKLGQELAAVEEKLDELDTEWLTLQE